MNKVFTDSAWADYIGFGLAAPKKITRINALLRDIEKNGNEGIGMPKKLPSPLSYLWSRRISETDHMIYRLEKDKVIVVAFV